MHSKNDHQKGCTMTDAVTEAELMDAAEAVGGTSLPVMLGIAKMRPPGMHLSILTTLVLARRQVAALTDALAEEERHCLEIIDERDYCEERADALAYAIAPIESIGEHSNLCDPWANAIEYLEGERQQHETDNARLTAEFERMRPVVAEALAWRKFMALGGANLVDAIDVYLATQPADTKETP